MRDLINCFNFVGHCCDVILSFSDKEDLLKLKVICDLLKNDMQMDEIAFDGRNLESRLHSIQCQ